MLRQGMREVPEKPCCVPSAAALQAAPLVTEPQPPMPVPESVSHATSAVSASRPTIRRRSFAIGIHSAAAVA
ncbi:hypothetical protein A6A07_28735 [Streptomyces sp. CB03911]|nr:hypothetical protein A6A07_28735 [Streptomyces sp. CB03911]